MKTIVNTQTLECAQDWIAMKSKGRYASILSYMNITDGKIDLIFRTHNSKYFMVELIDCDEVNPVFGPVHTKMRTGYISKRKYLSFKK